MPDYPISVRSEKPIPHDVLVEHIAVALQDFKLSGKVDVKMAHPFDDKTNVMFDDEPLNEAELKALDPYPLVSKVTYALRGRREAARGAQ